MNETIIQQQIAYYRARAGEYDEWFYRVGRYDRGAELNQGWFDEVAVVMDALHSLPPVKHVLELACGTGIWTQELVKIAAKVTAVDASAEVIEINREKVKNFATGQVGYVQADLFAWQPEEEYDLIFFSFWLSHVPPEQLDGFLDKVRRAVKPGGRLFSIDSMPDNFSSAVNHEAYQKGNIYHTRKLNDGQEYRIIKVFYEPEQLAKTLAAHGFRAEVHTSGRYFWYANGVREG